MRFLNNTNQREFKTQVEFGARFLWLSIETNKPTMS